MKVMVNAVLAVMVSATLLTGCASTGGVAVDPNAAVNTASTLGMAVFQSSVNQKCRSELANNTQWKFASLVMSAQRKMEVEDNVCGCVSQQATRSVTLVDLTTAALDNNARNVLVARTVTNALQNCVVQYAK